MGKFLEAMQQQGQLQGTMNNSPQQRQPQQQQQQQFNQPPPQQQQQQQQFNQQAQMNNMNNMNNNNMGNNSNMGNNNGGMGGSGMYPTMNQTPAPPQEDPFGADNSGFGNAFEEDPLPSNPF